MLGSRASILDEFARLPDSVTRAAISFLQKERGEAPLEPSGFTGGMF